MGPARNSRAPAIHSALSTASVAQSVASTASSRLADSVVACPDACSRNRGQLLDEARELARLQFLERGERTARAKLLEYLATFGEAMAEARRSKRLVIAFRDLPYLPEEVLQCGHLTTVNLVGLRLRSLPDCFVGDLVPTLRKLSLASNLLDDLPPTLANLEALEELNLVNNDFQVLPDCVCKMTNLSMLHLHSNRLVTLPGAISRLQRIRSLVLDSNEIAVLPSSMQFMRLQRLNLNKNALSAIPSWISKLRDLQHLSANENAILDFPDACIECGALESLSLGTNAIVDMPTSIGRFTQLRALVLDWNRIEVLPLQIRHLSGLQTLRLEGNPLKRPTLRFVLEHGPQGLFKWADHAAQSVEGKLQRDTVLQFIEVLRIISLEGIARSSIFTPELPMTFDDQTADHSTMVWEELMQQAWPEARQMWLTNGLPVLGEADDIDAARAAVLKSGQPLGRGSQGAAAAWGLGSEPRTSAAPMDTPMAPAEGLPKSDLVAAGTFWSRKPEDLRRVLLGYRDAVGSVFRENVFGLFRECGCMVDGRRRVCVPPREGFRCMRKCSVLKLRLTRRRDLEEHKQSQWQEAALDDAVDDARQAATTFVESDGGQAHFSKAARLQADRDEKEQHRLEFMAAVTQSFQPAKDAVRRRFGQAREAKTAMRQRRLEVLGRREAAIVSQLQATQPPDSETLDREIARIQQHIADGGAVAGGTAWTTAGDGQQREAAALAKLVATPGSAARPVVSAKRLALREDKTAPSNDAPAGRAVALSQALSGENGKLRLRLSRELLDLRQTMMHGAFADELAELEAGEAAEVAKIEEAIAATQARYKVPNGMLWGIHCALSPGFRKRVKVHKRGLEQAYIARRSNEALAEAQERVKVMRTVMVRWRDAGSRKVFHAWRDAVRRVRSTRTKLAQSDAGVADARAQADAASRRLQEMELAKWQPKAGDPSLGYVHTESGEWLPERPQLQDVQFRAQR